MININAAIIDGSMDEKCINNFDKVFNRISYEQFEQDAYLYNLWNDIKKFISVYYQKNKELLNKLLEFINIQLDVVVNDNEIHKELTKAKDGKYGK